MRFVRLDRYIRELMAAYDEPVLGYEEVRRHLGTDAAHVYGGIVATITRVCESFSTPVPYRGIPVATVKRTATGKGNAGKDAMCRAAAERWKWDTVLITHDEADALWVAEVLRLDLGLS